MDKRTLFDHDLIARLKAYEVASNQHDIEATLTMFTEAACIEVGDKQYCGLAALRAAHEYDMASRTIVAFSNFVVTGDTVACQVVYCDELDRAVGLVGLHSRAEFTFRAGHIHHFKALPPVEAERERHRRAVCTTSGWPMGCVRP